MTFIAARPGEFFTWEEVTRSKTATRIGDPNTPDETAQWNCMELCEHFLDPLRRKIELPINPTSWYRSPAVNKAIKGAASRSLHLRGLAVDFKVPGLSARQLADKIAASGLPFDQLIWYAPSRGGHVHVHLWPAPLRRQVKYAPSSGGYVTYRPR